MQQLNKQAITDLKAQRFAQIRKLLDLNQEKMGLRVGIGQSHVAQYEKGKRPIGKNVEYRIINELNINPDWWHTGEGEIFNTPKPESSDPIIENESLKYEELTYISTKARASFMELMDVNVEHETYWVLKPNPEESYADQVVIEIGGDSMEPNYWDGCKVRCKVVPNGDWVYLNSGVYAVSYGNFFVVKRVKNSPVDGRIILHSDNIETGGSTEVPLEKVRRIWRVLRIVDAPAR
ncbi:XRE family transcriptional regulator [Dyadobacter crusticola]|uniref:XRE family transcriptional regulator n=1 Tax=Dyadobacter crusticola TaxID=292407 RepID=UPI0004E20210|nr:XRE family transcriptional regulator [Dyadobacter crusticola]